MQLDPVEPQDDPGDQREEQDRARPRSRGRASGRRRRGGRDPGRSGTGTQPRTATWRAVAPPAVRASRVGYSDPPRRVAGRTPRSPALAGSAPRRPNVPTRHLEARFRRPGARDPATCGRSAGRSPGCGRRTPADRTGASSTGRSRPTTRWASTTPGAAPTRTCTSASTPCSARTSATRTASTARACGSRSTSSGTSASPPSATSRRYGIDRFVTLCKQRVLTYAARQTEQSIRLGMWMDWNDPDELRRLRDLLGDDPSAVTTIEGPDGPGHRHRRDARRAARDARDRRHLLHVQQREQRPDLGLPRGGHRRGWLYKGHDTMPWCARCGTGLSQMEMNEGYQDREDPGLTVRFPLLDRPGEALLVWTTTPWTLTSNVAAAVGAGPALRPRPAGRRRVLAGQGDAARPPSPARSRSSRSGPGASSSAGATRVRSTTCRRSAVAAGTRDEPTGRTSTGSCRGARSARTRGPASSTSPPAAARRTSSSARSSGCR